MTRTGQAAIDYARSRVGGTMPASGYCLQFVRQCFDIPSYYASAIDAWNGSPTKHPGDRNPPPAVPLFFRTPSQYDHVVFAVSPGEIVSTFNEDIRSFPGISSIEANFDGTYLGWTEDLNTVRVYEPTPPPQEDDMTPDESAALGRIDQNVAALERLWGDTSDRARKQDQTYDWSQQTVTGVGEIDAQLDAVLSPEGTRWTPATVVSLIAFAVLGLLVLAVLVISAATGAVPEDLERAAVYLAFVLAGGALSRVLTR